MGEDAQIIYMQTRLVRMMSDEFGLSIPSAALLFKEHGVFHYVKKMWELFRCEGDQAVFEDVKQYLKARDALHA